MHLKAKPASECDTRGKVEWVWEPYIPASRITVLDGDPGLGKSFVTLDLCARVTTGAPWPGQTAGDAYEREPANVVICNCEDEHEATIVPRLKMADAALSRVFFGDELTDEKTGKTVRFLKLPDDRETLSALIVETKAKLVVIDPIMAFLAPDVRANSDQDVRRALNVLNIIGTETGAAFLLVRHLNKGGGTKAIYRGGGSIGFVGLARSALMVARNPDNLKETLLLHSKANLSRKGQSLIFDLLFRKQIGKIRWKGLSEVTANQALREEEPPTVVEKAVQFLKAILAGGNELPVTEILAEGKKLGLTGAAIVRAKKRCLIFSRKRNHNGRARWFWSLQKKEAPLDEFLAGLPRA